MIAFPNPVKTGSVVIFAMVAFPNPVKTGFIIACPNVPKLNLLQEVGVVDV